MGSWRLIECRWELRSKPPHSPHPLFPLQFCHTRSPKQHCEFLVGVSAFSPNKAIWRGTIYLPRVPTSARAVRVQLRILGHRAPLVTAGCSGRGFPLQTELPAPACCSLPAPN